MRRGRRRHLTISDELLGQLKQASTDAVHARDKERLQACLLFAQGVLSLDQIAQAVGRARSRIQVWLDKLRDGGVAGLLGRKSAPGSTPALDESQQQQLRAELEQGRHRTAAQLQEWVKEKWGVELTTGGMYYWLGKLEAVLRVPRPQHRQHNEQKAAEFKFSLRERLAALNLPKDRPVKIWVEDEGRFGLHSFTRRMWTLRGVKPVVPVHQRYQWFYVFAALECTQGELQAAYWDGVNLDITRSFLEQVTSSAPEAEHIVIYDGAGFHLDPGVHSLPPHMHVIQLPPYSPQLNPVEGLWDLLRDEVCNRAFDTVEQLQERLAPALARYWEDASKPLSLVHGWIKRVANASYPNIIPVFN